MIILKLLLYLLNVSLTVAYFVLHYWLEHTTPTSVTCNKTPGKMYMCVLSVVMHMHETNWRHGTILKLPETLTCCDQLQVSFPGLLFKPKEKPFLGNAPHLLTPTDDQAHHLMWQVRYYMYKNNLSWRPGYEATCTWPYILTNRMLYLYMCCAVTNRLAGQHNDYYETCNRSSILVYVINANWNHTQDTYCLRVREWS